MRYGGDISESSVVKCVVEMSGIASAVVTNDVEVSAMLSVVMYCVVLPETSIVIYGVEMSGLVSSVMTYGVEVS